MAKKVWDAFDHPEFMAALQALREECRYGNEQWHDPVIDPVTIRGYVLVADVFNDRPHLSVYRHADLMEWHRLALAFLAAPENECESIGEAMNATGAPFDRCEMSIGIPPLED